MNKDLILVFVIAPILVEIVKAVIKELQDRRKPMAIPSSSIEILLEKL